MQRMNPSIGRHTYQQKGGGGKQKRNFPISWCFVFKITNQSSCSPIWCLRNRTETHDADEEVPRTRKAGRKRKLVPEEQNQKHNTEEQRQKANSAKKLQRGNAGKVFGAKTACS